MGSHIAKVLGWTAIILFVPITGLTFATGWIHDGWNVPAVQCLSGPYPTSGGPFHENTRVTGRPTLFPLGVDCTYDVPGDDFGPQTIHNYRLDSTVVLVVSSSAVVGGVLLVNRARRIERAFKA